MGIIHFIWLGESLMPEASILRVKDWQARNPEAELWLWIDEATLPTGAETFYQAQFVGAHFKLAHVLELHEKITTLVSSEKTQLNDLLNIAIYEARRLKPNYGAASDILRYLILFLLTNTEDRTWNAYFDHDVATGLDSITSFLVTTHVPSLFFPINSQGSDYSSSDALICTATQHPILKMVLTLVWQNYLYKNEVYSIARPLVYENATDLLTDKDTQRRDEHYTIFRTGPRALVQALELLYEMGQLPNWTEENLIKDSDHHWHVFIAPESQTIPHRVCPPASGANAWLPLKCQTELTLQRAIQHALSDIYFEAKTLKILRLDDQIKNIADTLIAAHHRSCEEPYLIAESASAASPLSLPATVDILHGSLNGLCHHFSEFKSTYYGRPTDFEEAIARYLIHALNTHHVDFNLIQRCQFVSRYTAIRDFYRTHSHLKNLIDEDDGTLKLAALTLSAMLEKNHPGETAWGKVEIYRMIDDWFGHVAFAKREDAITQINRADSEYIFPVTGGNVRLSPATTSIVTRRVTTIPASINLASVTHLDLAVEIVREEEDDEGEGEGSNEQEGGGRAERCCIIM